MDVKEIKEILRILEEQDVTEFELEQDGTKIRICRGQRATSAGHLVAPTSFVAPVAAPSPDQAAPGVSAPAEGTDAVVNSPIVGTFFRAADPNSAPFVNVGDRVRLGQVLCIIEAMKLMNEIEAEVAGEVMKVHPENGQPVQYGDPLFTIRPS